MSSGQRQAPVVLLVDDDAWMGATLAAAIEDAGFAVEVDNRGRRAIERFAEIEPDVVILDVVMPGLDGFETCAALREEPGGAFLPIVMITGQDDDESIDRAYEAGATDFITKPVNLSLLAHRLRYIVRSARTVRELRESKMQLASAQRMAHLGSWDWDPVRDVARVSEAAIGILGLPAGAEPRGLEGLLGSVHPEDHDLVLRAFRRAVSDRTEIRLEHRVVGAHGEPRIVHQDAVWSEAVGGETKLVGTVLDVTDRKQNEQRILELAFYDGLTRLPNREFFQEHAARVLGQARRRGRPGAVLSLDLDGFKRVNDAFGHAAGDGLLQAVAERLSRIVRGSDCLVRSHAQTPESRGPAQSATVARFGGDEFSILLSEVREARDAAVVAERILEELGRPFLIEGKEIFVTASIGIAVFPVDGEEIETLLKRSDAAMYHAKNHGRDRYQFYSDALDSKARERLLLASRLRTALKEGGLSMVFQPKLSLGDERIIGCEALMRWHDSELGVVPPSSFIPAAEETGLIVSIGRWALRTVCEHCRRWRELGLPPLPVAVNVSARQLKEADFVGELEALLAEFDLTPSSIEVEITEWVLVEDTDASTRVLDELRELGVRVSLDDFGTGYSSLSYLKRYSIDAIKIDRSFVREVTTDAESGALVIGIIALSDSLGLNVVAEGIETEAELTFLREGGCREGQGYWFSRPLSAADFEAWYGRRLRTRARAG